jgi:WD40 repeat protein
MRSRDGRRGQHAGWLFLFGVFSATVFADGAYAPPISATSDVAIMHLLRSDCFSCHNPDQRKGGLLLTSREALLKGGDSGPAIEPGNPEASLLWQVLAPEADPHMPPKKQLSAAQIDLVRNWIASGATWNDDAFSKAAERTIEWVGIHHSYQAVLALALSPDATRLAAGRGGRIQIYDVSGTNFPVVAEQTAHRDLVRSLAWSPDGTRLASGSHGEVTVWNPAGLEKVWSATNLNDRVTALSFSSHGGALIVAHGPVAQSGWLRVMDSASGRTLAEWQAHGDTINALTISREGGLLATGSSDRLVRIWELVSQREIAKLEGHTEAVMGLAFSTNAAELVTVGLDHQLKVWDLASRQMVITTANRKHGLNAVLWSPDGATAYAAEESGNLIAFSEFKRHSGAQSSPAPRERSLGNWNEPLLALAMAPDGKRLFAGSHDGAIYVLQEGKLLTRLKSDLSDPSDESDSSDLPQTTPVTTHEPGPSFLRDVLPLLSRAGCMASGCHAKVDGQNGFHLSVFSYDPQSDYRDIAMEGRGRRVSPAAPGESLLLLKSTGAIEHGGGQRIVPGSEAYQVLVRWIQSGMAYQHPNEPALVRISIEPASHIYQPEESKPLRVTAHYSDETTRDVTPLASYLSNEKEIATVNEDGLIQAGTLRGEAVIVARYMGIVETSRVIIPAERRLPPEKYAALPAHNFIDRLAHAHFEKLGLFPSDLCSDAEFLRRSSLDTLGVLPSPEEARAFLASDDPEKRAKWIERLLSDPAFGDYLANKWADLLRPNPDRVGIKSVFTLDQWLKESFAQNKPYDQFVREILLLEGNNHADGPAVIYRDRREPAELATLASQLFLGIRMDCAKCHQHPTEKWTQTEFYGLAAFFASVKQKGAGLSPPISAGKETFYFAPGGTVKHPVTDAVMEPRPLGDAPVPIKDGTDPRQALVEWLIQPENPFFARAAVNRVWSGFFGRGFVEPVDDFRASNPASNEELLTALANEFARHGYDLKHLARTILSSRLYQLSSVPNEFNLTDTKNFSRSYRRRLPAEVLLDAVNDITGMPDEFEGCPPGTRAVQTWSYKITSHFMDAFGRPNPSSDCPCERDMQTSVVQALHLMNSRSIQRKLAHSEGRVKALAGSERPAEEIIAELYLSAYSRFPSAEELALALVPFNAPEASRQNATEDVLWALLNSAEFIFNH